MAFAGHRCACHHDRRHYYRELLNGTNVSIFGRPALHMVMTWFFAPAAIIEKVKINLEKPIYDIYVFHASLGGTCNLTGHAKALISTSIAPVCPDLTCKVNWIAMNKDIASNFFHANIIDDLNSDDGGHLYRHRIRRINMTNIFSKYANQIAKNNQQYFSIRIQFKHNNSDTFQK